MSTRNSQQNHKQNPKQGARRDFHFETNLNRVRNLSPAMGLRTDSRNRVWNWLAKLVATYACGPVRQPFAYSVPSPPPIPRLGFFLKTSADGGKHKNLETLKRREN